MIGSWLSRLFEAEGFAPHGTCLAWQPGVLWLHVLSDSLTGLAYYSIPAVLAVLVWKRRDLGFGWVAWLFAAFILACGTTHLLGVWTLWNPDYYIQGVVKAMTAAVSVMTAIVLWPLLPRALATPTPEQMARVNSALHREVTEKEAVATRLRDSEQRYASVFDNVAEALFTFTIGAGDGFRFEMINPTAARALGMPRDAVTGARLEEVFGAADGAALHALFASARDSGNAVETEQAMSLAGAEQVWHVVVVPLKDQAGRPVKMLVTARDVTERRRLEEEVLQSSKLATIGTMSAGIAHEMSQPLNAISLWATMGRRRLSALAAEADTQVGQAFQVIEEQAQRMRKIIDHMRAYSRRDDGDMQPFDAAEATARALGMMRRELTSRDIALETAGLEGAPCMVLGRPVQFEQVIVNLLGNARDAIVRLEEEHPGAPRRVRLRLTDDGPGLRVEVEDTGGGIPDPVARRLFEPFFTTKPAGTGTGLGLAICERIIQSMGGTITAETVAPEGGAAGARFTITVPQLAGDAAGAKD